MRAYDIALFAILFNVSLTLLANTGIFPNLVGLQADDNLISFINETVDQTEYKVPEPTDALFLAGLYFVSAIFNFITLILTTLGFLPFTYAAVLGLSPYHPIILMIQVVVWIAYAAGAAQFIAGRSEREMS